MIVGPEDATGRSTMKVEVRRDTMRIERGLAR
jgi:hypothetical protein